MSTNSIAPAPEESPAPAAASSRQVDAVLEAGEHHLVGLAALVVEPDLGPTRADIIHNLVPVTLGNIVGGAGLVGFVYWTIYRKVAG